jgi:hypothetical protein
MNIHVVVDQHYGGEIQTAIQREILKGGSLSTSWDSLDNGCCGTRQSCN